MINPLSANLDHVLEHTRDLWVNLRHERIFITGGTGFFGCWILESLLWANERLHLDAKVTLLSRTPQDFVKKVPHIALNSSVTILQGDTRSFSFPEGTFSHIIHAATDSNVKQNAENSLLLLDTILEGTRHVLDFSLVCGARRFLLTSSGAVYGRQPDNLTHIPEGYVGAPDPFDAKSTYGHGKRMAEHLCMLYTRNAPIDMKIARCFAFVGPYMKTDMHFAIGNFIRDGMNGGPIIVQSDGSTQRSYLYAADLVIWLWTILFNGKSCYPYNVGSDKILSIAEVADLVAQQFSPKPVIEIRESKNPSKRVEQYVPEINRAKNELSLNSWIDLSAALRSTIAFLESSNSY